MLHPWNARTIQWFKNASAYTEFHKRLAQKIAPYLEPGDTLCDIGCGLGRLDLELAPLVKRIDGLDICPQAVEALKRESQIQGIRNLHAYCRDFTQLRRSYDVILISFFGEAGRRWQEYLPLCRRKLIRIVHQELGFTGDAGSLPIQKKNTVAVFRSELQAQGMPFHLQECALEFGQPFAGLEEAHAFMQQHRGYYSPGEMQAYLEQRLVFTGDKAYPYYLPKTKKFGIFILPSQIEKRKAYAGF